MPPLADLQRRFRAALLEPDREPVPAEIADCAPGAGARLGVYRGNVRGALIGALRLGFPAVARMVGEDFFAAAAGVFAIAAPPRGADLYEWGGGLADFLAGFAPARGLAWLADLARLEWAVGRALHAPMLPQLDPAQLAGAAARVRFVAHPSLSLLALSYPVRAIWQAALIAAEAERHAALAAIAPDAGGEFLAVLRGPDGVVPVVLGAAGFGFARDLTAGTPLDIALVGLAAETAASLLALFFAQGFFVGFHDALDGPASDSPRGYDLHG